MGKKIIITESQLKKIVEDQSKIDSNEAILDPLRNKYYGVKGMIRGFGYDYYKYGSELRNILRDLKKIDRPNDNMIIKLNTLLIKVKSSNKMRNDLKTNLIDMIDGAITRFETYKKWVDKMYATIGAIVK